MMPAINAPHINALRRTSAAFWICAAIGPPHEHDPVWAIAKRP
jgi:hypothetical protein